jgi:hypothetical protein
MELFSTPILLSSVRCRFPGAHKGKLHEYEATMVADLNGTPVKNAKPEKVYICEGHFPDSSDPTFSLCTCGLCTVRARGAQSEPPSKLH